MNLSEQKLDTLIRASAESLVEEDVEYANSIDLSQTEVSAKALRKIRKHLRRNEHSWWNSVPTALRRTVAAVLCVCTLAFFTCMSRAPARAEFIKIFVKGYEKFAAIFYVSDNTPVNIEEYNEPVLQPNGTIKQVVMKDANYYIIQYTKDDEILLVYHQRVITDAFSDVDIENCIMSDVQVNGTEAKLFTYVDGHVVLTWHDNDYAYSIYSYSSEIHIDTLLSIAESIK